MDEFRFANPIYLGLLPLLLFIMWRYKTKKLNRSTLLYSDVRLVESLLKTWRTRLRLLPNILQGLAWIILIIALARPQIAQAQEIIRGEGIDIALALDISPSMSCPDFVPNRLEAAKQVIEQFIGQREFDRIGLIVFASNAYYQSPPTLDYNTLRELIADVPLASDLGLEGKTAIGVGIGSAANLLRHSSTPSKVIILLTDGVNNAGLLDPITAAQAAHALGIRIYTIGIGRIENDNGDINCENDLDENLLQRIAEEADGLYFRAGNQEDLKSIYERIDQLEKSPSERVISIRWQDTAHLLIPFVLFLLLIERISRLTVFDILP